MEQPVLNNLFTCLPEGADIEVFETLAQNRQLKLERILSRGHCANPAHWYQQETDEWVLLVQGAASLQFDGQPQPMHLRPGDYLLIPAGQRHAVTWTDPDIDTLWLALHFQPDKP